MSFDLISLPLSDIATFKYGKTIRKQDIEDVGLYPVHSGYTTVGYLPTYMYDEQQLIIVCRGAGGTGDVKMSPSKVSITNLAIVITCDETKVCKEYLYWVLTLSDTYSLRTGSAQPQITINSLDSFNVTIHQDLVVQKRIARFLDKLNSKIDVNAETNQTLEAMAQAIFKSWFVDFDPVKAKMNGEQPQGMDEATASLFPDKLVESELGLIPEGWSVKSIRDFGKVVTGKTPPKKVDDAYSESGVPFITPTDIDSDVFVAETKRFLSASGVEVVKKNLLPEGSICVTCIGSQMGKAVIAPSVSISNQQINSVFTKKKFERNFLFLNLRSRREEIFLIGSSGSTMPIINKSTFEKLKVVTPSESLIKVFDKVMSPLLDKIYQNAIENQTLSTMRDTLLPKLLFGEIELEG